MQMIEPAYWVLLLCNGLCMLAYVGMLIYACVARSSSAGAKRLAIAGVALLIVCGIMGWLTPMIAVSALDVQTVGMAIMVIQSAFALLHCIAIGLIFAAVFKDRSGIAGLPESHPTGRMGSQNDPNPYSSPTI